MILSRGVKDSTDKFELRAGRFRDQKGHDVSSLCSSAGSTLSALMPGQLERFAPYHQNPPWN